MSEKPWYVPDEYVQTIELSNGEKFYGSGAETAGNPRYLWLWLDGTKNSLSSIFEAFNDPSLTSSITIRYSEIESTVVEGYTRFLLLRIDSPDRIGVRLGK